MRNYSDILDSREWTPNLLEYIEWGFDKKDLYKHDGDFSRLSISDITKLITWVSITNTINLQDFFLSMYREQTNTQMDISLARIREMSEQNFTASVQNYISFIEGRLSWFRAQSWRGSYGKSAKSKNQIEHKVSEVERKIQFFCNQLNVITTQKRQIPEQVKISKTQLILAEIKDRVMRFIRNPANPSIKLLR